MIDSRKLEVVAVSDREIEMTRIFDAPRQLVFDAFTKPDLVKRWLLGPPGWSIPICEIDLKVGGKFRYVWRSDADGSEIGMWGVYREIDPPGRLVHNETFDEAWYPGDALVITVFTEDGGITTMKHSILYDTREARDIVMKSPMESGAGESYDKLAELLASTSP
jgi:uncharacterized protein YndB with AHSA1/START domain